MATMSAIVASHEQEQEQKQELVNEFLKKIDAGNTKVMTRFTDYEKIMESMAEVIQKHKLDFQSYETKTKIFLDDVAMKTFLDKIDLDMSNIIMEANDMMRSYKSMAQIKTSVTENVIPSRTYASVTMPITPTQSNLVSVPSGNWADDVDADEIDKIQKMNPDEDESAIYVHDDLQTKFINKMDEKIRKKFCDEEFINYYKYIGFVNEEFYNSIDNWFVAEGKILSSAFAIINKSFDELIAESLTNAKIGQHMFVDFTSKLHTNAIVYTDVDGNYYRIYLDSIFCEKRKGIDNWSYINAKKFAASKNLSINFYHSNFENKPPAIYINSDLGYYCHICGWKFSKL